MNSLNRFFFIFGLSLSLLAQSESESNISYGMNMGFGAITIDGVIYNQIAFRPDLSLGKLGVGLDVIIYMDADGNIRTEEWDEPQDILDKILYVRWGQPGDPFYARYGTLDNVTLGYGIFVTHYSNMMEFPSIRKVGIHTGFKVPVSGQRIGLEGFIANLKEFSTEPDFASGLFGLRATYGYGNLTFGVSLVSDGNQYLGLNDRDDDGYPDLVDDFPGDPLYAIDTDSDGQPDEMDLDIDGDGITDVLDPDDPRMSDWWQGDYLVLDSLVIGKSEPLNIKRESKTLTGVNFDVAYPVITQGPVTMTATFEIATFLGDHISPANPDSVVDHGFGFAPGIRGKLIGFLDYSLQFRQTTGNFAFGLFNQNYDLQRVTIQTDAAGTKIPVTRDMYLLENPPLTGLYGSLGATIMNWITLSASYQDMRQDTVKLKGITGRIGLTPNLIPKVREAYAYVNRMNVDKPFDFLSEGTLMGYRATIGIGGGVIVSWNFRQTLRDLNGDGRIDTGKDSDEVITVTSIETGISF